MLGPLDGGQGDPFCSSPLPSSMMGRSQGSTSSQARRGGGGPSGRGRGGSSQQAAGNRTARPQTISSELTDLKKQFIEISQRLAAMEGSNDLSDIITRLGAMEDTVKQSVDQPQTEDTSSSTSNSIPAQKKTTKKKNQYVPLDINSLISPDPYDDHFSIKFDEKDKRAINPFDLVAAIRSLTGNAPAKLYSANKTSFIAQIKDRAASEKILTLCEVGGRHCETSSYPRFNQKRGLIYIYNSTISDLVEFREALAADHVIAVEPASFIKPRETTTQVFLLTFCGELPFSVYIPGESRDTRVVPYENRPMMCRMCQSYGHTQKRCPTELRICRRCGNPHETDEDYINCSAPPKCYHCRNNHPAGHRDCPRHQREQKLLRIQETEGVSLRRASQILSGVTNYQDPVGPTFPTHFTVAFSKENTPKFSPWCLEKSIAQHIGAKPIIRSKYGSKNEYVVEVSTRKESDKILTMKTINGSPISISANAGLNLSKGLVYIDDYDMSDFDSYAGGLRERCGVVEAVEAKWIKTKSKTTKPLLLSFRNRDPPAFLNIPGEKAHTRVTEYKDKPMICKNCQNYGHSLKYCSEEQPTCGRCSERGHTRDDCEASEIKCHHCRGDHFTGSHKCQVMKLEQEILHIQRKERVSKGQAKLLFKQRNPNFSHQSYSAVLQGPASNKVQQPHPPNNDNNLHNQTPSQPPKLLTDENKQARQKRRLSDDHAQQESPVQIDLPRSDDSSPPEQPSKKKFLQGTKCHLIVQSPGGSYRQRTLSLDRLRSPHPTPSELEETRRLFKEQSRQGDTSDRDVDEDMASYERDLAASRPSRNSHRGRAHHHPTASSRSPSRDRDRRRTQSRSSRKEQEYPDRERSPLRPGNSRNS